MLFSCPLPIFILTTESRLFLWCYFECCLLDGCWMLLGCQQQLHTFVITWRPLLFVLCIVLDLVSGKWRTAESGTHSVKMVKVSISFLAIRLDCQSIIECFPCITWMQSTDWCTRDQYQFIHCWSLDIDGQMFVAITPDVILNFGHKNSTS